jgi:hypothetical protein
MNTFSPESRLRYVDSDSADRDLGARFRRTRPGPELNLIETFLRAMPLHIPDGCRATVFREPRLESGFPDLVIVVWREDVTRNWRFERAHLEAHDLRLMHFLHHARRAPTEDLVTRFGRRAAGSLERLRDAAMIRQLGSAWSPCALRRSFAATKIIAVEAKVGKWADVLNQALLNTWFASKSYVLAPGLPSEPQMKAARQLGIGVCSLEDTAVREVASDSSNLPRSYASWMFNDWAWRSSPEIKHRVL